MIVKKCSKIIYFLILKEFYDKIVLLIVENHIGVGLVQR